MSRAQEMCGIHTPAKVFRAGVHFPSDAYKKDTDLKSI